VTTLTRVQTLVTIECYRCAVLFAMPDSLNRECLKDHSRSFYCPNGHGQVYTGETDEARYKRLYKQAEDRAAAARAEADRAEASRRAWKGQTTRLRNRAVEGLCPFCGKFVAAMGVHVAKVHPEEHPRELTEAEATS
jgi:hypothetical protein